MKMINIKININTKKIKKKRYYLQCMRFKSRIPTITLAWVAQETSTRLRSTSHIGSLHDLEYSLSKLLLLCILCDLLYKDATYHANDNEQSANKCSGEIRSGTCHLKSKQTSP